jgi:hypothetical protein
VLQFLIKFASKRDKTMGETEAFGIPLRVNAALDGEEFALVCGDSMVTHTKDNVLTLYVRGEMREADWMELRRKWVPSPRPLAD